MIEERRAGAYERIYTQLETLVKGKSPNLLAAMATISSVLHAKLKHHSWTGFYFVANPTELHVGPYQGPVACQVLKDRGVCLASVKEKRAVVVPDVRAFPGHIACDSRSMSEIVVPVLKDNKVLAVLDIDSATVNMFDNDDIPHLEKILALLTPYL